MPDTSGETKLRTLKKPNREGLLAKENVSGSKTEKQKQKTPISKLNNSNRKQNLTKAKASHIINRYSIAASAVGVVPVPGADVVGVSALQADLVEELAYEYGLKVSRGWGKRVVIVLAGSMGIALGARTVFSSLKVLPVIGSALGGGTSAIASAVTTYTLGHILMEHFEKGGTLDEIMLPKLVESAKKYVVKSNNTVKDILSKII